MSISLFVVGLLPALRGSDDAPAPSTEARLIQETERPKPYWSGTVNMGLTLTEGNSETLSAVFNADATREGEHDRYTLKSFWNYSEQVTNGVEELTQRTAGLSGQYDYFPGEKWYLFGKAGVETNEQADLDVRYYAGPGVGYQFVKDEEKSFSGEAGLLYFNEKYDDGTDDDKIALNLAYDFDWKISPTTTFEQDLDAFPAIDDFDDVFVKVDSRLTTNLTKSMISTLQYVIDFDHTPAAGAKQTDHRVVFTLGWAFGK